MAESVAQRASPRARFAAAQARHALSSVMRDRAGDSRTLIVLVCLTVLCVVAAIADYGWFPLSAFAVPLVLGSLLLERGHLAALAVVVAGGVVATIMVTEATPVRIGWAAVMTLLAAMLLMASYRSQLGVHGRMGESMLIDLRDRLQTQSELPVLPEQWYAQAMMRSAGGAQFAGDFIVAAMTMESSQLEVVVVDVSGKGLAAGTRALQLSGAFGGLLGALPPEQFLQAANRYLLRQDWSEGFATAAHLAVSLETGVFELRTAGHPPGVQWRAGSGRWQVHESHGPALGLIERAEFAPISGRLESGDALMLYTDGLVETPERDYTLGIDKLLGESERMLTGGWENSAGRLLERLDSAGDDRAILFLHRR
ncbi:MAG: PP2C family protein-serine/threonine phosphatase [Nocardioidaceae bacterium]